MANVTPGAPRNASSPDWYYPDEIAPWRLTLDRVINESSDRLIERLRRHWLLVVNAVLGLFASGAMLTPVLFAFGFSTFASRIFTAYHLVCAQIPSHSYYVLGYQLALCARNLAIYGSLFAGSVAYRWVRPWLLPLDWRLWLLTTLPMALDGGTQLFGWRESTWELRTLTGVVFGLGVCWLLLPQIGQIAHGRTPPVSNELVSREEILA